MSSAAAALVAAALTQGAIALVLLWILGAIRVPMVRSGKMPVASIALSREPWPEHEKKVANAFDNQFQLPLLFYVAIGLTLYFGAGWLEVVLAWLFVISRILHAVIFATRNRISPRFLTYTFGYFILLLFWLDLIVRLISIAAGGR